MEESRIAQAAKALDHLTMDAMWDELQALRAEVAALKEQLNTERSIDEYISKRNDEVHAVAEKHWKSYWEELGKRKELQSRLALLEKVVKAVEDYSFCGPIELWRDIVAALDALKGKTSPEDDYGSELAGDS